MKASTLLGAGLLALAASCSNSDPNATINTGGSGGSSSSTGGADAGVAGSGFGVDTSNPEVTTPVVGDSGEFLVVARLSSPGGKRTIVLVRGQEEQEIAPSAWNLPPVGIRSVTPGPDSSAILVCWDILVGQEPAPDTMPQPSQGMRLWCRYRAASGQLTAPFEVGFDNPTWLKSVGVDTAGAFNVMMLRDGAGTLFGKVTPGDGLYKVVVSNGVASPAELIQAR